MNVTTVPPLDIKDMDEVQEHDHEPVSPVRDSKRRAKIVCTIGPASSSEAVLRDLMRMGNIHAHTHEIAQHGFGTARRADGTYDLGTALTITHRRDWFVIVLLHFIHVLDIQRWNGCHIHFLSLLVYSFSSVGLNCGICRFGILYRRRRYSARVDKRVELSSNQYDKRDYIEPDKQRDGHTQRPINLVIVSIIDYVPAKNLGCCQPKDRSQCRPR